MALWSTSRESPIRRITLPRLVILVWSLSRSVHEIRLLMASELPTFLIFRLIVSHRSASRRCERSTNIYLPATAGGRLSDAALICR